MTSLRDKTTQNVYRRIVFSTISDFDVTQKEGKTNLIFTAFGTINDAFYVNYIAGSCPRAHIKCRVIFFNENFWSLLEEGINHVVLCVTRPCVYGGGGGRGRRARLGGYVFIFGLVYRLHDVQCELLLLLRCPR